MKEIELEAIIDNIPKLTSFVEEFAEEAECPAKVMVHLDVAIDEIFSNIAHYAYPDETGKVWVRVDCLDNPKRIELRFEDEGIRYNPLEKEDPDIKLSAEERQIGGLGIFIVKKSMDAMEYSYEDGKNILTIVKNY